MVLWWFCQQLCTFFRIFKQYCDDWLLIKCSNDWLRCSKIYLSCKCYYRQMQVGLVVCTLHSAVEENIDSYIVECMLAVLESIESSRLLICCRETELVSSLNIGLIIGKRILQDFPMSVELESEIPQKKKWEREGERERERESDWINQNTNLNTYIDSWKKIKGYLLFTERKFIHI